MSIKLKPHYEISAAELGKWVKRQGEDGLWSVDGDPLLMGLVSFPCTSGELAQKIKAQKGTLLVLDTRTPPEAQGQTIKAAALEKLAFEDNSNYREFIFAWKDSIRDELGWSLIENRKLAAELAAENL